jgi:hypothetical protein
MPIYDIALSTGETLTIDASDENAARNLAEQYLSGSVSAPQQSPQQDIQEQPQEREPKSALSERDRQALIDAGIPLPGEPLTIPSAIGQGILNLPLSTGKLALETAQAVLHPIQTVTTIKDLGVGLLQNVIPENITRTFMENDPEARELARQVGEHFKNQYGSIDAVKEAFAKDPAFILADISTVFGIGAATTPGRVSSALRAAETAINPVTQAARATSPLARGTGTAASEFFGLTTGTGSLPIREAFNAAVTGGERAKEFLTQMRRPENVNNLVNAAETSLQDMVSRRNADYLSSRTRIAEDATELDISPIRQKVRKQINSLVSAQGDVVDPAALRTLQQAQDIINDWRDLTPIGLDGLKQRIYTLAPLDQPNTYRVIKSLYDEVKDTIVKQAPEYSSMMGKYAEASDLINEIKRTLSINPQATVDTQIRKLLSSMRDNVNASFGRRAELVSELERASGRQLTSGLAGVSLSPLTPRGLARIVPTTGGAIALSTGGASIPGLLGGLLATSPRLVGEAAYTTGLLGRTAPLVLSPEVLNALYQSQQAQNIGQQ